MKKTSKNVLFIVIGILVAFTIDVAAEAVISSGAVSYSNTTVSAALDELFSAVDINNKIGTTDISMIGDGTITGAIDTINDNVVKINNIKMRTVYYIIENYTANTISEFSVSEIIVENTTVLAVIPMGGRIQGKSALATVTNDGSYIRYSCPTSGTLLLYFTALYI